jgi:hypothetical protein
MHLPKRNCNFHIIYISVLSVQFLSSPIDDISSRTAIASVRDLSCCTVYTAVILDLDTGSR